MHEIIKDLPYPPTINHYYYRQKNGAVYIGIEGKIYRKAVAVNLNLCKPIVGKIKIHIDVYPPDKRRRDLDNINKCLLDSIQCAGIIKDDYDIDELSMKRHPPIKGGKVKITMNNVKVDGFDYDNRKKIEEREFMRTQEMAMRQKVLRNRK